MLFDISNVYIAGVTDTTTYNTPDIVFAYPTQTPDLPDGFFPSLGHFADGDVIIVGPLCDDGLLDMSRAAVYEFSVQNGTLRTVRLRTFSWVEKLTAYKPLSELGSYLRHAGWVCHLH